MRLGERLQQFAIAFDQLVNTVFGGYADETISARCWRNRHKFRWWAMMYIVDTLFFWQRIKDGNKMHCQLAFESEQKRMHMPHEYRDTPVQKPDV